MNTLRIIGGQWRGRRLRFPDAEGLRPTPGRVRETLFNWLGQDLSGLSCLDLFAGSGALGFEAASRGAARVVMVERSPKVAAALADNARTLGGGERLQVLRMDALEFASSRDERSVLFNVIFLDPPYRQDLIGRIEPLLPRLVADDGTVYLEAERALSACGAWQTARRGRAGQVYFHLMQRG